MKRLCILHANCQGEPLAFLLRSSPHFDAAFTLRHVTNYKREPIPEEALAQCALFLFQPLGEQWDELASSRLEEKLPASAISLQVPNMFFKGYWPFWTNAGTMAFGDSFLDYLADQGLSLSEAMRIYLHGKLGAKFDLDAIVAETLERERVKEQRAFVKTVDFVAEHWKNRQLFSSVNHPQPELCLLMADAILERLGLPPVPEAARQACPPCDADFDLPIHPEVGRHFGLPFVSVERTYPVFGKRLTFAQYVLCYLDCRQHGGDFVAYLHQVAV